jgi:hypothetical protein
MNKEQKEIDLLLSKGFEIQTKLFGKTKIWNTKPFTLKRLLELSNVYIKMDVKEQELTSDDLQTRIAEQYIAVNKNAYKCAEIISICVTDNCFVRLFLKHHFLKQITATQLKDFTMKLLSHSDYQSFITSIILLNGNRVTKPTAVVDQQG